jgi:hypothetical protein|tara:strand:+ start:1167 stop:1406 length:240 start_codon:yes stop_codon:yes gene_type:complete
MANKRYKDQDIKDNHGPMNSVSKDDALVWVGVPPVKHLSQLDPLIEKQVRAKKNKAKKSSKKLDRHIGKMIKRNIEDGD